eukprot:scaffold4667_cov116-Isochrysis_galbana.AAC.3
MPRLRRAAPGPTPTVGQCKPGGGGRAAGTWTSSAWVSFGTTRVVSSRARVSRPARGGGGHARPGQRRAHTRSCGLHSVG